MVIGHQEVLHPGGPVTIHAPIPKNPNVWTYPDYDVDGAIVSKNSEFASSDPVNPYTTSMSFFKQVFQQTIS